MSLSSTERALALHTAARRYCERCGREWGKRQSELEKRGCDRVGRGYTAEAYDTFPRYLVLDAIRMDVERLDPETELDAGEMLELLLLAGQCGESMFTRDRKPNDIASAARQQERDRFGAYLLSLSDDDLRAIEPMPYRRVLDPKEAAVLWSGLRERWSIGEGYWYPLAEKPRADVVAFNAWAFDEAITPELLRNWLRTRGVTRAWEFGESIPAYTLDIEILFPLTTEGFSSSEAMDWIVYESHEDSTTVGGWLLREVQAAWPDWESNLWTP